jgi:hypothetical protein
MRAACVQTGRIQAEAGEIEHTGKEAGTTEHLTAPELPLLHGQAYASVQGHRTGRPGRMDRPFDRACRTTPLARDLRAAPPLRSLATVACGAGDPQLGRTGRRAWRSTGHRGFAQRLTQPQRRQLDCRRGPDILNNLCVLTLLSRFSVALWKQSERDKPWRRSY